MAGLQRSAISFRRQGSSGLVWDDKLLTASGELIHHNPDEKSDAISATADQKGHQKKEADELRRSKSDGRALRAYRTVKVQEAEDPPSPRLSGCGFCSVLGKQPAHKTSEKKRKSGKRKP